MSIGEEERVGSKIGEEEKVIRRRRHRFTAFYRGRPEIRGK
jgi:hypothetical protein